MKWRRLGTGNPFVVVRIRVAPGGRPAKVQYRGERVAVNEEVAVCFYLTAVVPGAWMHNTLY